MANPNIVNVANILGKTAVLAITTTPTDIISNAAASNTIVKVNNLIISNIHGSSAGTIIASVFRGSVEYKVAHVISVPAASSVVLLDKSTGIYLEEGDTLRLTASANSVLHAVSSYEIIS